MSVSVRVGHFKTRPDPEARSLGNVQPVQGSWRVGLGSGQGFGSGLTSLDISRIVEGIYYTDGSQDDGMAYFDDDFDDDFDVDSDEDFDEESEETG